MANITISNLNPAGSEFFADNESYLNELTEEAIVTINGGWFWAAVGSIAAVYAVLPDAQKQWVNRRFINIGQALFQPVRVY